MLHPYDPYAQLEVYNQYYVEQVGSGTKVFKGRRIQRGYGSGIGSFIGSLTRGAAPFLKSVGKQLLKTGVGLASDVIGGKSFKDAALTRGKDMAGMAFEAIRDALSKGMSKKRTTPRTPAKKRRKIDKKKKNTVTKKRKPDVFDEM